MVGHLFVKAPVMKCPEWIRSDRPAVRLTVFGGEHGNSGKCAACVRQMGVARPSRFSCFFFAARGNGVVFFWLFEKEAVYVVEMFVGVVFVSDMFLGAGGG